MQDNFSASLLLRKPAVSSTGGIVAAQHRRAAEIGAEILAQGGDAVDALIATSFALGALEPWMSGIGGGGAMVLYRAREQRYVVIDFGMHAPSGLNLSAFALAPGGVASDLFPWARVQDDRNMHGPTAVAVPGVVDGMRVAHEQFARLPWAALLEPAIACAEEGLLVDWFATESIASAALDLRRYAAASATYLPEGLPPVPPWSARAQTRLPLGNLAQTLRALAQQGAREFYDGEIARTLASEVQSAGGFLSTDDLSRYQARTLDAGAHPDAAAYASYARALQQAYAARLTSMGDVDGRRAPACTTHFCVVDRDGNMASVTQTLLSIFGSRFVAAHTGVLLNNGIMWFDPEPGRANSLAPGKRCLTNYCPVIGAGGAARFCVGASGGRRILPAVTQLLSFLIDFGDDLDTAMHRPRIDASEGDLVIGDAALTEDVHAQLAQQFEYVRMRRQTLPFKFACPSAVLHTAQRNQGATEVASPWADAVAEGSAHS